MLRTYYQLTKPGIVYGNCMAAAAGFLLASNRHFNLQLFVATLVGIGLVIASACVANNYIDRGIDKKMERTKKRALVSGKVSAGKAIGFASVLALTGFIVLALGTNWLTVFIGIIGYFFYVVVYGVGKRKSVYGTMIGSISGSMPLVAGYTAVTNSFDSGAALLFLIMTAWQMPHFYAIAMYRLEDYQAAVLPVWPAKKGMHSTKLQILLFIALFMAACASLTLLHHAGIAFLTIMFLLGANWLWKGAKGFRSQDDTKWARGMFGYSLIVLMGLSAALALNAWLP